MSVGQIGPVRDCIANVMVTSVSACIDDLVSAADRSRTDYAILNILQDETKFHISVDGHHTNPFNVMSTHALLVWAIRGKKRVEEIICPPTALSCTTAEAISACLRRRLPQIDKLLQIGRLNACIFTQDSCAANVKFANSWLNALL